MASPAIPAPHMLHRPVGTGDIYVGPGDLYRFLVTGAETGDDYFAMEALVVPGGGPPPHIHRNEDETFYVLEGRCEFLLGDQHVTGGPGDFVSVPRGNLHRFYNASDAVTRLILTFTPAGIEHFFEETLEPAESMDVPVSVDNLAEVAARYAEVAARYGMTFFLD